MPKDTNPNVELTRMAREIQREKFRQEYDLGFHGNTKLTRKEWVDKKLREEGLL